MKNLLDYNMEELMVWLKENSESSFRAKQIFSWIYKGIFSFDEMKNLPKNLKEKLNSNFKIYIPEVVDVYSSNLDGTKKMLLKLEDGNLIESVIMKYKHGNTICVSTQVGCRMGCKFCASTIEGRVRNLTSGEILGQVLRAGEVEGERISNIVLMGSGEPLDNYDNVVKFLREVNAEYGLNIGQRHITLSTCGLVPKIRDLSNEGLNVTLAISLHAFSDEKRREIMPIANKYSISEILEECRNYIEKTNRRVTFEYSLVKDINDSKEDAKALSKLLKGILCHVNLIPVNEIKENSFKRSSEKTIDDFAQILKSAGIEATVRREMGSDINAACGQLRRSYMKNKA
ncbi:23S rRNA (adenine(2503)-C(2))-methyltransferase RlmN [uncultured Clostridium sp.]|uniref:23S rRNA (adenine(2503)-C(2))-methyltransferase RlmN n=1 Tax=uncultured Clostridium sp. TaxID=59620 RepID=UPI00258BEAEC|nr:23S rRNA (adenine(2503)-C(2))-methyltransferase RlmN [uncultured Clostridium sp.]